MCGNYIPWVPSFCSFNGLLWVDIHKFKLPCAFCNASSLAKYWRYSSSHNSTASCSKCMVFGATVACSCRHWVSFSVSPLVLPGFWALASQREKKWKNQYLDVYYQQHYIWVQNCSNCNNYYSYFSAFISIVVVVLSVQMQKNVTRKSRLMRQNFTVEKWSGMWYCNRRKVQCVLCILILGL